MLKSGRLVQNVILCMRKGLLADILHVSYCCLAFGCMEYSCRTDTTTFPGENWVTTPGSGEDKHFLAGMIQ